MRSNDDPRILAFRVRAYGSPVSPGPRVLLLHGGPGAPGSMAPIGRALAGELRLLEPFQRRAGGDEPLTTARHVADLHRLVELRSGGDPVSIVGSSHGAMLGLAYAAAHPETVERLVLVGCGTYDEASRAEYRRRVEARLDDRLRARLAALEVEDPDERLRRQGELLLPVYSYDLVETELELERCDARGHRETWEDELRLQASGAHPAAFAAIRSPVLMVHGSEDPHPGPSTRDVLNAYLPRLEYVEWERCGHYPWLERATRETFLELLRARLTE